MRRHFNAAVGILVLLLFLTFAGMACSGAPEPTSTPVPTATPLVEPSPTATPVPPEPEEVLSNAVGYIREAGAFWFVLDHENGFTESLGGLQLVRVEGAITEDKISISAEANLGRVYIEVDAILIGEDTFLTNPLTGQWEQIPGEENPVGFLRPVATVQDMLGSLTSPEFMVPPVAGEDYQVRGDVKAEAVQSLLGEIVAGSMGVVEVVIDSETFEMKSARISGALQIHDSDSTVRILEASRYGEDFLIEPPDVGTTPE